MAQPVPNGYHTLNTSFTFKDSQKAIDFYKKAFNAKVTDEKTVFVTVTTKTVTPGGEWAPKGTPRVNIEDQKTGNVQANPNPVLPPKQ